MASTGTVAGVSIELLAFLKLSFGPNRKGLDMATQESLLGPTVSYGGSVPMQI